MGVSHGAAPAPALSRSDIIRVMVVLTLFSSSGFCFPTSNTFLGTQGFTTGEVQYLRGFYMFSCVPMMFVGAYVTNRCGANVTLLLGGCSLVGFSLLYLFGSAGVCFYLAELLSAAGYGTLTVAGQVVVFETLARSNRRSEFSWWWSRVLLAETVSFACSNAAGSHIAAWLGLRAPYLLTLITFSSIVVVTLASLLFARGPRDHAAATTVLEAQPPWHTVLGLNPRLFAAVLNFGLLCMWYRIAYSLVPPFLAELGLPKQWYGAVTGPLYAAVGVAGLLVPWIAPRMSLRALTALLFLCSAMAFGLLSLASGIMVVIAAFATHTIARGICRVSYHTEVNGIVDDTGVDRATAISAIKLSDRCFASLGLALSGLVIDTVGLDTSMIYFGVASVITLSAAMLLGFQPKRA